MDFEFKSDLVLENERVKLIPLDLSHLENLIPVGALDENLTFYSTFSVYTPEALKQFIEQSILDRENKTRYAFAIFDKLIGKFAGSTSFGNISNQDQRLEIG